MNVFHRPVTISSRDFNQDTAAAKRAAKEGPVFITDRGRPSHVLLSIEDYQRLETKPGGKPKRTLLDIAADPSPEADFDFEPPRLSGMSLKPADLD